jgi:hypothetical protein
LTSVAQCHERANCIGDSAICWPRVAPNPRNLAVHLLWKRRPRWRKSRCGSRKIIVRAAAAGPAGWVSRQHVCTQSAAETCTDLVGSQTICPMRRSGCAHTVRACARKALACMCKFHMCPVSERVGVAVGQLAHTYATFDAFLWQTGDLNLIITHPSRILVHISRSLPGVTVGYIVPCTCGLWAVRTLPWRQRSTQSSRAASQHAHASAQSWKSSIALGGDSLT